MRIYLCKLPDKRNREELDKWLACVSPARQARLKKFRKLDDAYRSIIGDMLVRYALTEMTGEECPAAWPKYNEYGKPYLPDFASFFYNISHSCDYTVCAVHDQEIGTDIEKEVPFEWQQIKSCFTEAEYQEIVRSENPLSAFYSYWTMKESYVKAAGKGLSTSLGQFTVQKTIAGNQAVITDSRTGSLITEYICRQYRAPAGYHLSVCAYKTDAGKFETELTSVSFDTISSKFGPVWK